MTAPKLILKLFVNLFHIRACFKKYIFLNFPKKVRDNLNVSQNDWK